MTITEFLLARIAEDEARARPMWELKVRQRIVGAPIVPLSWPTPDRVLAECEAKRRILESIEDERQRKDIYNGDFDLGLLTTDGDLRSRLSSNARWAGLDVAVRALVLPYADHPDFREEWRP